MEIKYIVVGVVALLLWIKFFTKVKLMAAVLGIAGIIAIICCALYALKIF